MTRPKYVVGAEGALRAYHEPPKLFADAQDGKTRASWPGGGIYGVERGLLVEPRHYTTGRPIYIREIPEAQAAELELLDARIRELTEQLRALETERQEVLMMAAARGDRVRAPKERIDGK